MTASLNQVAEAIALRATEVMRAVPYPPDDVNPPTAFVVFAEINRAAMTMGTMEITFDLVYLVSSADTRSALKDCYRFSNPDPNDQGSLWSAFDTNKTLGLTGVDVTLLRHRLLGREEVAAYGYFGGAFEGVALISRT